MSNKLKLLVLIVVTLLNTQGCIESNPSNALEPKTDPLTGIIYSTTVLGTVPPYVDIVIDDTSFYFYDVDNNNICKMNKVTGQKKVLNVGNSSFRCLCHDANYLYGHDVGDNSRSIYRIDKNFTTNPEQIFYSLEKMIYKVKAGGGYLYLQLLGRTNLGQTQVEFCKYDFSKIDTIDVGVGYTWFDVDSENVYWMPNDSLLNSTLWKMSHSSSVPVKLANQGSYYSQMSESYIYFWNNDKNLLRASKQSSIVETIISVPVGFYDDNEFIIKDEKLFVTDYHDGTLRVCNLKSYKKRLVTLEKKGRYDDYEMNRWLWADKDAVYWIAGPNEDTQPYDGQWGTLFRTVVKDSVVNHSDRW
ncbi:MAG: hypothetical protein GX639_13195 [Fibrobacter sp.]|nr:hypothetical protein [Fibrobacter sp.]